MKIRDDLIVKISARQKEPFTSEMNKQLSRLELGKRHKRPSMAYIYSFPFWLYVDTSSDLPITQIQISEHEVRIYPPFRSGPANFITMPHINFKQIPFPPGSSPELIRFEIPQVAAYPLLGINSRGKAAIFLTDMKEWDKPINPFPMDSLRLDFLQTRKDELNFAEMIVGKLLTLIRWHTRQWWVTHSMDGLLSYKRAKFPISMNGMPVGKPLGLGCMRTVLGNERGLDTALWALAINHLRDGVEPPAYDLLLLDAQYFSSVGNIKRSVLDLSMACEQAIETVVQRIWKLKSLNQKFKRKRVLPGDDLIENLGRNLKRFTGHSYEEENPKKYSVIKDLWKARNSVAHGGFAQYVRDGRTVKVVDVKAREFCEAAYHCVRWIQSLEKRV